MQVIIIEGGIGVGKSTITNNLQKLYPKEITSVEESIPKEFNDYIVGRLKPFPFQLCMAAERAMTQGKAIKIESEGRYKYTVMERSIFSDYIFAQIGITDKQELHRYICFAESFLWKNMVKPQLTIYIKSSLNGSLKRIKERGRPGEEWYLTEEGTDFVKKVNDLHDKVFLGKPDHQRHGHRGPLGEGEPCSASATP